MGDLDPHLIHGSPGPPKSSTETASRSDQPFLQGLLAWQTDRPRCSVSNNRPHLHTRPDSSLRYRRYINHLLTYLLTYIVQAMRSIKTKQQKQTTQEQNGTNLNRQKANLNTHTHTHTQTKPFYGPFSGTTQVSRCQKRSSGLYGARED